ncbi:MAG: tetratricopeptide repeat protein [Halobacteriota archaeon]
MEEKKKSKKMTKLPKLPLLLLIPALLFVPGLYIVLLSAVALTIIVGVGIIYFFFFIRIIPAFVILLIGIGVLIGVYAILYGLYRSVFGRKHSEPALLVDLSEEPILSNFIESLCKIMETKTPDFVLLHFGPTFFVQQGKIDVFNGTVKGRILAIGTPLLGSLTVNEFKAIIAHEFAHFTGRDTLYSSFVSPVYVGTTTACEEMGSAIFGDEEESLLLSIPMLLPYAMLRAYLFLFQIIDAVISRSRERRADLMATEICGKGIFSNALKKVVREGKVFGVMFSQSIPEELKRNTYANYCNAFSTFLLQKSGDLGKIEREAMAEDRKIYDRHPPLKKRLSYLPNIPDQSVDSRSARELLVNPKQYEQKLSKFVFKTSYLFGMDSVEQLDEILELDPNDVFVWSKKAMMLVAYRQYKEAIECCDKAIEIEPNYTFAWNVKGGVYHILKKYQEAVDCFDTALKIDPELSDVWHNKGVTYYELDEYQKAIDCFDKALKIDPDDNEAWNGKGIALKKINRGRKAEKCFKKCHWLSSKPNSMTLTFRIVYTEQIAQKYILQNGKVVRWDEQKIFV